jgi:hypothetical protein
MWRWDRVEREWINRLVMGLGITLAGCSVAPSLIPAIGPQSNEPARSIQIQQTWQLQAGDSIGPYKIAAGLGDISIDLAGGKVYAPFDGRVQPNVRDCVLFSSPDLPAYLFRLCGLEQTRLGQVKQGDAIGSGQYLHFAALRKLPEGTWTIVEPSKTMLERLLSQ